MVQVALPPPTAYLCRLCARRSSLTSASAQSLHCPVCHRFGGLTPLSTPFGEPEPTTPPTAPSSNSLAVGGWLIVGGAAAAGLYKFGQAAVDEDFETIEFPPWFRRELIDAHIERHGRHCTACDHPTSRRDLQVDHIVALVNGGRTSRANARVICRWCNAEKGGRNRVTDYFWGRGA